MGLILHAALLFLIAVSAFLTFLSLSVPEYTFTFTDLATVSVLCIAIVTYIKLLKDNFEYKNWTPEGGRPKSYCHGHAFIGVSRDEFERANHEEYTKEKKRRKKRKPSTKERFRAI